VFFGDPVHGVNNFLFINCGHGKSIAHRGKKGRGGNPLADFPGTARTRALRRFKRGTSG
jgi:hypothetical protein